MPKDVATWLKPQNWLRDSDKPCVGLGAPGSFDDTHIAGPCAVFENGHYLLWYTGSRGTVAERVFKLGLATSRDGVHFEKHRASPVFEFSDGKRSILTPTLLHNPDGSACRENGLLRMWFSSVGVLTEESSHTLHDITSKDGLTWSAPSDAQLENLYAPSVLKDGALYKLWYNDVSTTPWCFRYAESRNGRDWTVAPEPVMVLDQPGEYNRLFYPTVRKAGELYLMWYGAYQPPDTTRTAIHFAVSRDGRHWTKNAHNPVFGPDPSHDWESHFTTHESILKLPDGSWRMWYASRTKPPFTHKYYAIGTARLTPPS